MASVPALLRYFLTPSEAEARVTFKDPEGAKVGQRIRDNPHPTYAERLYQAVLQAAERHPQPVEVYGPLARRSQQYWQGRDPEHPRAFFRPGSGEIRLGPRGVSPYVLTHELIHFLQHHEQPTVPPGLDTETYPYGLIGTEKYPATPREHPLDVEADLNRRYRQRAVPASSYGKLFDFYQRIMPWFPTPETLKQPQ